MNARRLGSNAAALLALHLLFVMAANAEDYPELVAKGIKAAEEKDGAAAIESFHDALLLKKDGREAMMNLGLAMAQSGDHEGAVKQFDALAMRSQDDANVRARALYNRGRSEFELANAAIEKKDRKTALEMALKSMASSDEALAADPKLQDAEWNREQARHLLEKIAQIVPPPPQQNQQGKDQQDDSEDQQKSQDNQQQKGDGKDQKDSQDKGDEQNKDQSESEQKDSSKDGDEKQQKDGDQQKEQDSDTESDGKDGEEPKDQQEQKQQEETGENEEKDGKQASASQSQEGKQPDGMSAREAEKLLQMLDDEELMPVNIMRGKIATVEPEKQW